MRPSGDGAGIGRRAASAAATSFTVLILAAAVLLCVLRPLSILMPGSGLDLSWMVVLGEVARVPARWGVDITFTYGPASALVTRYYTDGYIAAALPILVAVALAGGLCGVCLARIGTSGRRFAWAAVAVAVVAMVAGLAAELSLDQDSFYFAFALSLFLVDVLRRPGDRASLAAVASGAALLGVLALAKTSYGAAALGLFVLADVRSIGARRRPPLLTPLFLLAFLVAFASYGQRFGDLVAYLDLQGQVASGYGEAMYLPAGRVESAAYLAGAALLVMAAGWGGRAGWIDRVAAALGAAFILVIGLKAGFVRADVHTQIAWSLLGLGGLAIAVGPVLVRSAAWAAALGTASLLVLWVVAPLFFLAATDRVPKLSNLPGVYGDMRDALIGETEAWARFLSGPSAFAAAARTGKTAAWARVAAARPLPRLAGGVDILPSEQSALLANGLDYRYRPSFQEYSTYTAGLIAANAAFYAGPDAPAWVLFGEGGLDDRYPTATEGGLWPDLLRLYEPTRRVGPWLALHRRAAPLPDVLGPPRTLAGTLGEPVAVNGGGPIFARITVAKTLLGRLAALVFRPPALRLQIKTADGRERSYRFIPALAASGFLLSPLASGADAFAELGFGETSDLGGQDVSEVTVVGSRLAGLFYERSVPIVLQPVSIAPARPTPDAEALFDDLARERPWRLSVIALGRARDLDGDRLSANAPTSFALPVGDGTSHRLRLGFGIADGAWTTGTTQGVCFQVKVAPAASAPLWRRCLDPRTVPADRGPQTADIDLPSGTTAVTAETTCPRNCDWGWSYWDDITPEP